MSASVAANPAAAPPLIPPSSVALPDDVYSILINQVGVEVVGRLSLTCKEMANGRAWKILRFINLPECSDRALETAAPHLVGLRSVSVSGAVSRTSLFLKMMEKIGPKLTTIVVKNSSEGQRLFGFMNPQNLRVISISPRSKNKRTWSELADRGPYPKLTKLKLNNIRGSIDSLLNSLAGKLSRLEVLCISSVQTQYHHMFTEDIFNFIKANAATLKRVCIVDCEFYWVISKYIRIVGPQNIQDFTDAHRRLKERIGVGFDVLRLEGRVSLWRNIAMLKKSFQGLEELYELCWPKDRFSRSDSITDMRPFNFRSAQFVREEIEMLQAKFIQRVADGKVDKSTVKILNMWFARCSRREFLLQALDSGTGLELSNLSFNGFSTFLKHASDDLLLYVMQKLTPTTLLNQRCGHSSLLAALALERLPLSIPSSVDYVVRIVSESQDEMRLIAAGSDVASFVWRRGADAEIHGALLRISLQDESLWRQFVSGMVAASREPIRSATELLRYLCADGGNDTGQPIPLPSPAFALPLWNILVRQSISKKSLTSLAQQLLQRCAVIPNSIAEFLNNDTAIPTMMRPSVVREHIKQAIKMVANKQQQ